MTVNAIGSKPLVVLLCVWDTYRNGEPDTPIREHAAPWNNEVLCKRRTAQQDDKSQTQNDSSHIQFLKGFQFTLKRQLDIVDHILFQRVVSKAITTEFVVPRSVNRR